MKRWPTEPVAPSTPGDVLLGMSHEVEVSVWKGLVNGER